MFGYETLCDFERHFKKTHTTETITNRPKQLPHFWRFSLKRNVPDENFCRIFPRLFLRCMSLPLRFSSTARQHRRQHSLHSRRNLSREITS